MRDCEKVQRKFKTTPAITEIPANIVVAPKDSLDSHNLAPSQPHSRKNSSSSHMEKQVSVLYKTLLYAI